MNHHVIKALNQFLEGNYMAIHAYDQYMQHINDHEMKQILQTIQQHHQQHASRIAERIQNLGGTPVNDVGLKGKMILFLNRLRSTKEPISILKDALIGEDRGIRMSQKLVEGDLDQESLTLVNDILSRDEKHVQLLNQLIHQRK